MAGSCDILKLNFKQLEMSLFLHSNISKIISRRIILRNKHIVFFFIFSRANVAARLRQTLRRRRVNQIFPPASFSTASTVAMKNLKFS